MSVLIWIFGALLQGGVAVNFSIYVHSEPGFVFNETTTSSSFFYGRQLNNSVQVFPLSNLLFPTNKNLLRF